MGRVINQIDDDL